MTSIHQGPHKSIPAEPVPEVENYDYNESRFQRWKQVSNGDWYAFYCNVGPNTTWNVEHPDDPNWWYHREYKKTDYNFHPDRLVCRHGAPRGHCPDGSCGLGPEPPPTEEEVAAAGLRALKLLKDLSHEEVLR